MMKYEYVFLLGRPGCGKSALYRELEKHILESGQAKTFERVDDFPKVWARLQGDDAREREGKERIYSRRTDDGDYLANDNLFDDILKEVNADVLRIDKPDHMVFIEFARSNYVEALQNFDPRILEHCMAIYMEVSFDICWARNVARHEAAIAEGGDDHLVGREAMEEIYLHDDQEAFVEYMKDRNIPVLVVNNEADGEEHLRKQINELFQRLF
jgi:adenylate kinase family enzyme